MPQPQPNLGLTNEKASELLGRYGPNAIPRERRRPLRDLALHFWGPVPWVLETTLVLTLLSRRYADAIAVAFLLVFNALVASVQERKANDAVDLLRSRVVVQTRVKRDGSWGIRSAEELVSGDLVHLAAGDIVPADVKLTTGSIDVDQSVLTGESTPRTLRLDGAAFAGSMVTRGEATALVTATGIRTTYGKTAELVRIAKAPGLLERVVLRIVAILSSISIAIVALIAAFAVHSGFKLVDVIVFAVMILLASVPIALPAAFTLATTFGSLELVRRGALITRLSALEDAASMDVLCVDKTGTITQNHIAVRACIPFAPFTQADVLSLAAAASDAAGQDPIDLAIIGYAKTAAAPELPRRSFTAFDPADKYSSATVRWNGTDTVVYKGSPPVLASKTSVDGAFNAGVEQLATAGDRVIAVGVGQNAPLQIVGLVGLADPPRPDAAALVTRLHELGVAVALLTGDSEPTALHVAAQVGIGQDWVHASIYPADKLDIVKELQSEGHVVGMTGDGINDAPALRQAGIGIAVSNATDIAKAASGIVLTQPGLANIVAAIESSRAIFERMITYTMMKLVKYFEIIGVLTIGFFALRQFLLTPELMVALLIFNDFVTLSISTDNVTASRSLDVWRVGRLVGTAVPIAVFTALTVLGVVAYALYGWHVDVTHLRGVVFLALVVMGQIALYIVRDRKAVFGAAPSRWVIASSLFASLGVVAMVTLGALTPSLPTALTGEICGILLLAGGTLMLLKVPVLRATRAR
jgi:H+-transporting ATPase